MNSRFPRSRHPSRRLLACALASCLAVAAPAVMAQSTSATIRGQITVDSAPATDAQITATNTATGLTRKVQATNGTYNLGGLPPGTYRIDAVANGLVRNTINPFDPQFRQHWAFGHAYCENRLAVRRLRVARDFHVIELPRREDRSNRTLNVAVIECRTANQAGVTSNRCFVDLTVAADRDGVRHGAAAGLLGVLCERRSARCCQTQQQEGQSGHGGNIHESTRRVQRADGCYPLLLPNVGRSWRRRP